MCLGAGAEDWPTYQHDNQRSGITPERLDVPLTEVWVWRSHHAPQPAWPDPAQADFAHLRYDLVRRVAFDNTFHVVLAGDTVYFGSSADDTVYSLDAGTGEERWSFVTGAPVRLAPSVSEGKVYVGSDDGFVYCLDGEEGALVWKHKPAAGKRNVVGNGRMTCLWPVRTGVLVVDGVAYCCAGLFPSQGVNVCALDATDGSTLWQNEASYDLNEFSPQGYLLASARRLYVPNGRTSPFVFDRQEGKYVTRLESTGGTYALLTEDRLVSGPANRTLTLSRQSKDRIATFRGHRMVVADKVSYLLTDSELCAIDRATYPTVLEQRDALKAERSRPAALLWDLRKKRRTSSGADLMPIDEQIEKLSARVEELDKQLEVIEDKTYAWRQPWQTPCSMILAGDVVLVGGDGVVAAFDAANGEKLWAGAVDGKAYGLAVANGRLFVSTDKGAIHCFSKGSPVEPRAAVVANASPYPNDSWTEVYASAAEQIVAETGIERGYCLVYGCGEGRLAYELAKRTNLHIVGVEEDEAKVRIGRKALSDAGLYGVRAVVHHEPLSDLPYSDYFANLIVSDTALRSSELPGSVDEVFRVLRPCGGVAFLGQTTPAASRADALDRATLERWLGASAARWKIRDDNGLWAVMRRAKLEGSGEWTHQYADAGNSACSGDGLLRSPMEVLWFGKPGPRPMIDRHHRGPVPLSKDGRLFVTGNNRVIAVDAYNGSPLWDVAVPDSRRVAAQRDAGTTIVTDDCVYVVARDTCHGLDLYTGEELRTFRAPQLVPGEARHWGYVGSAGDLLFGTGQKQTASYTDISLVGDIVVQYSDIYRGMVTSDYLFCLDRRTGDVRWTYKNGVMVNPTIAVGGGRMYFVESNSPKAVANAEGKSILKTLLSSRAKLVALDVQTGKRLWDRPIDSLKDTCQYMLFLAYAQDTVLVTGTSNKNNKVHYYLYAFEADTGKPIWDRSFFHPYWTTGGDHGEQTRHPAIVGDTIYAEPYAFDLRTGAPVSRSHPVTGEQVAWDMFRGAGCGTISASATCLFYRSNVHCMNDLTTDAGQATWGGIRTGCWINMIPAGGVLLVPEGSSGCTCAYPIQSSIAYVPTQTRENWSAFSRRGKTLPVKHLALNLGAPGDQRSEDGTLWLGYPRPGGRHTLGLDIEAHVADGAGYFWYNSDTTAVDGTNVPWVFVSGCSGPARYAIPVMDGASAPARYTVRLYFADLSNAKPGARRFDVKLQGDLVLRDFDIVSAVGGPKIAFIKELRGVEVSDILTIELVSNAPGTAQSQRPILNGVELIRQDG